VIVVLLVEAGRQAPLAVAEVSVVWMQL